MGLSLDGLLNVDRRLVRLQPGLTDGTVCPPLRAADVPLDLALGSLALVEGLAGVAAGIVRNLLGRVQDRLDDEEVDRREHGDGPDDPQHGAHEGVRSQHSGGAYPASERPTWPPRPP